MFIPFYASIIYASLSSFHRAANAGNVQPQERQPLDSQRDQPAGHEDLSLLPANSTPHILSIRLVCRDGTVDERMMSRITFRYKISPPHRSRKQSFIEVSLFLPLRHIVSLSLFRHLHFHSLSLSP
jgi:hypothetical protein